MPRKRLSMRMIREVLRLHYDHGLSSNLIARACGIARSTCQEYIKRFVSRGLVWPLPESLENADLDALLFSLPPNEERKKPIPDWKEVRRELSRKGVTLKLLWKEYKAEHPDGYGYTQFTEHYRLWSGHLDVTMHQNHKAGEKLFVDYAGMTMDIVDAGTGEVAEAQIFVATLGASNFIFAEATPDQSLASWIGSHTHALQAIGGVPEVIVPDNLKSGVKSPCRYEPEINPTYQEWAEHHGLAVIPARVRKPRDKAKVESAVQIVERWVLAPLRNSRFFSILELNEAIREKLEELNGRPLNGIGRSRKELLDSLDKPALRPLPKITYEIADWKKAKVNLDYHIEIEKHFYSVPYTLARKHVEARCTQRIVEIFYQGTRIASHRRSYRVYQYTTNPEHMPKSHQEAAGWTPERFKSWGGKIGPFVLGMVEDILGRRQHPEQGYRSVLGLLRLESSFGAERLNHACQRALRYGLTGRRAVCQILKKKQDMLALPEQEQLPLPVHDNVRGANFYQ